MIKRLTSKEEENKKRKRNQIIIGVILIAVMLLSTLGYAFIGNDDQAAASKKIIYNGHEFLKKDSFWFVKIGNLDFAFRNNPNEVPKINSEVNYLNKYSGEPLYISSESQEAESEIYMNLYQISERVQRACFEEKSCTENLPVKTCSDNFIIININENIRISQNESCVFISGPRENITAITDEFLFKILGIEQA